MGDSFSLFFKLEINLLFCLRLIKFDQPVSFSRVDIGRLGPEKGENSIVPTLVRAPSPPRAGCHRYRTYAVEPRAVKFGDSPNSHVQVNLRRRDIFAKNYVIELDLRTFYQNGLLLMIPVGLVDVLSKFLYWKTIIDCVCWYVRLLLEEASKSTFSW